MELVLFIGIPATGKSSFYKERFFRTHVRINLDMLKTRHRERLLMDACLRGKTKFVVDNTNVTRDERARYIPAAKAKGFAVRGYFFHSSLADAIGRNRTRTEPDRIPDRGVSGRRGELEPPSPVEGFDALFFVRIDREGKFAVDSWREQEPKS